MFTVGQVSKFLGLSRDTLKFYEEKNLIHPIQDELNGYRKYNILDINEILPINFYRDIDIEIKKIQEITQSDGTAQIEAILDEKQQSLEEEIAYKQQLLERIKELKQDCQSITESLGTFTIREMQPIVITGDLEKTQEVDGMCTEILEKYNHSSRLKKAVNLSGLSRIIHFEGTTITKEQFVLFEKANLSVSEKREVITYSKCLYIVIEVPIITQETDNIDDHMAASITQTAA
ncbi:MAG: MerR family transcriptional regulator, partial [Cellulosilyticaceae bacterium]